MEIGQSEAIEWLDGSLSRFYVGFDIVCQVGGHLLPRQPVDRSVPSSSSENRRLFRRIVKPFGPKASETVRIKN